MNGNIVEIDPCLGLKFERGFSLQVLFFIDKFLGGCRSNIIQSIQLESVHFHPLNTYQHLSDSAYLRLQSLTSIVITIIHSNVVEDSH